MHHAQSDGPRLSFTFNNADNGKNSHYPARSAIRAHLDFSFAIERSFRQASIRICLVHLQNSIGLGWHWHRADIWRQVRSHVCGACVPFVMINVLW
jgi:hypothetical protein